MPGTWKLSSAVTGAALSSCRPRSLGDLFEDGDLVDLDGEGMAEMTGKTLEQYHIIFKHSQLHLAAQLAVLSLQDSLLTTPIRLRLCA